jgi:hypothetical protein
MVVPDFSTAQLVRLHYIFGSSIIRVKLQKPRWEIIQNRLFLVGQLQNGGMETGVAWDNVVRFDCK